jgi:hypothetical protein
MIRTDKAVSGDPAQRQSSAPVDAQILHSVGQSVGCAPDYDSFFEKHRSKRFIGHNFITVSDGMPAMIEVFRESSHIFVSFT